LKVSKTKTPPKPACVDLHIHSTASDGSSSPLEIIEAAEKTGLRAIAITDHDTLEGSAEALACQDSHDVEVLSGIEISALFDSGTMHILGYLVRLDDEFLRETLQVVQGSREERNLKIIKKLQEMGLDIAYDEVAEVAGGGIVGRPHIAQVLIGKGIVRNLEEAFVKLLRKGAPAYQDRYRLEPAEAIQTILGAGGVPVLAHPSSLKTLSEGELDRLVSDLKKVGLKGIEAYYPGHGPSRIARYLSLAKRHGLVATGGTDFHGRIKPGIHLGVGSGDLRVPYRAVEELREIAASA
jgi:predicted metal-dependent phosphoesterase TrpH